MHHLRLLEKVEAWKKDDGFNRRGVVAERQRRTLGYVRSVDDPEHLKNRGVLSRSTKGGAGM